MENERMLHLKQSNFSAHTDTPQKVAASRQLLRAGGLQC
jgi:hypothetical protein